MNTVRMTICLAGMLTLAAVMNPDPVHAACAYQLAGDLNNDCRVDLQDFAIIAANWLVDCNVDPVHPSCVPRDSEIVWVGIKDDGFTGEMSRYETTNAQFAQYLNDSLASGDIIVDDDLVTGSGGLYDGQVYYQLDGPGHTGFGATNGGKSRINYSDGTFTVDGGFENHPVTYVSWYGAMAFAGYYGWRLPTEWEWEAVAGYIDDRTYATGKSLHGSHKFLANYNANGAEDIPPTDLAHHPWAIHGTSEVGYFETFGYGLADMSGNVWEWTCSVIGAGRRARGGGWDYSYTHCRVDYNKFAYDPNEMNGRLGFRVCR